MSAYFDKPWTSLLVPLTAFCEELHGETGRESVKFQKHIRLITAITIFRRRAGGGRATELYYNSRKDIENTGSLHSFS